MNWEERKAAVPRITTPKFIRGREPAGLKTVSTKGHAGCYRVIGVNRPRRVNRTTSVGSDLAKTVKNHADWVRMAKTRFFSGKNTKIRLEFLLTLQRDRVE